jgi:hypothetical protein
MAKRTTITNGVRPARYFFAVLILLSFIDVLKSPESKVTMVIWLVSVVMFGVLHFSRKIEFDDENIYRNFGRMERAVPFTRIESVEQSGMKVTSTRMWKVTYLNDAVQKHSFQFIEGTFQHGSTNTFIQAIQRVNPRVVH